MGLTRRRPKGSAGVPSKHDTAYLRTYIFLKKYGPAYLRTLIVPERYGSAYLWTLILPRNMTPPTRVLNLRTYLYSSREICPRNVRTPILLEKYSPAYLVSV